jgi:toluene monooxygenase system protein B
MGEDTAVAGPGQQDQPPQPVPVNAIFADDFVQILVPVTTAHTGRDVAEAVAVHVEGKRVRAQPYEKAVFHNGRRLPPEMTVAEAGIGPMDHVRVEYDLPEDAS